LNSLLELVTAASLNLKSLNGSECFILIINITFKIAGLKKLNNKTMRDYMRSHRQEKFFYRRIPKTKQFIL